MLGMFFILVPCALVASHFTGYSDISSIVYKGNGDGVWVLAFWSLLTGSCLMKGRKLPSIPRLFLIALVYLALLVTFEILGLNSGTIGKFFHSFLYGVPQSITILGLLVFFLILNNVINQLVEKENAQNFDDHLEKLSKKASRIRAMKAERVRLKIEREEMEEKEEKERLKDWISTPARVPFSGRIKLSTSTVPDKPIEKAVWRKVPLSVIPDSEVEYNSTDPEELHRTGKLLEQAFSDYGVSLEYLECVVGPSVTRFEFNPSAGLKTGKVLNLEAEMAMTLASSSVRIEAPIPNSNRIGVEVPNQKTLPVVFKQVQALINSDDHPLKSALGLTIDGEPQFMNLAEMPHLLVAGATGSGKSVGLNTMISSIIMRSGPDKVQFSMVDPKMVELTPYNGIPHLREDVITDPLQALEMVSQAVVEMESRYQLLQDHGVRHIDSYNNKVDDKLPYYVIVIDEFADLMEMAKSVAKEKKLRGNPLEKDLCRIAQKARAVGIHLVLATQRPSVDVVTGLLKANFPSRIAFSTKSGIDSRTILDQTGAESLLGKGDMLYFPKSVKKPLRVQGLFLTEDDVNRVVKYLNKPKSTGLRTFKRVWEL